MVLVPRWDETKHDRVLEALVDSLLAVMGPLGPSEDLRLHTKAVQAALAATLPVAAAVPNPEEIDLTMDEDDDVDMAQEMTEPAVAEDTLQPVHAGQHASLVMA